MSSERPKSPTPTTVRFPARVTDWLNELSAITLEGTGPGATASSAVGVLIEVLALELRRTPLTLPEARLLADITAGSVMFLGVGGGLVANELYDATAGADTLGRSLTEHYEAQHAIPAGGIADLSDRLRALGPAADLALRLALRRWWLKDLAPTAEGFTTAGLRIILHLEDGAPR